MSKDIFKRYIWLVDTIYRAKSISFKEINALWLKSSLSNGEDLPLRTFHNHRKGIEDLFDILIECDARNGYRYYIENAEAIEEDELRSWLFNTFTLSNLVNESQKIRKRILPEPIPSGQRYLADIIEALREDVVLEITYQGYTSSKPYSFEIEPYFIKAFKQRWYVIANNPYNGEIRTYALDRIQDLTITNRKFVYPEDFDPEEYFLHCFGIINNRNIPVCQVKIKVNFHQAKYLRSLPLHFSQKEIKGTEEYAIFEYHLKPAFDFRKELLSMGEEVEVLEPVWFREEVASIIEGMKNNYRENNKGK